MTIMIDTNVILDVLMEREPFFTGSYSALKKALEEDAVCLVSATAVTDIFYLLQKGLKNKAKALEQMERLLQIITVTDTLAIDIRMALSSAVSDFEDAVVTTVAERNGADYILTRDAKHFRESAVGAITPEKFLAK